MDLPEEEKAGIPAWVMTFADLMSLLMCFFVLLLSFAEMDATKFKQIAQEMEKAFGVQRKVPAAEVPMGTTPIFSHFSPGVPKPTPLDKVQQETSQDDPKLRTFTSHAQSQAEQASKQQLQKTAEALRELLREEITSGMMKLEQDRKRIIIRIEEKSSFPSGSADLNAAFEGIIGRISRSLASTPGEIAIEGHTDNIPIRTERFRSNWDLSAARAAAVANALIASGEVQPTRIRVQGYAETRPLAPNDNPAQRSLNRRVEIVIDLAEPLSAFEARAQELIDLGLEDVASEMGWQSN